MKNTIFSRLGLVSAMTVLGVISFISVARAGEGGIAGSAAFTVDEGVVKGVAVSAAVGKESAGAAAFNYKGNNDNGLQNSAFAVGTAGTLSVNAIGDPAGFNLNTIEDEHRATPQNNSFTSGYGIQLGTASGDVVNTAPVPEPDPAP